MNTTPTTLDGIARLENEMQFHLNRLEICQVLLSKLKNKGIDNAVQYLVFNKQARSILKQIDVQYYIGILANHVGMEFGEFLKHHKVFNALLLDGEEE